MNAPLPDTAIDRLVSDHEQHKRDIERTAQRLDRVVLKRPSFVRDALIPGLMMCVAAVAWSLLLVGLDHG